MNYYNNATHVVFVVVLNSCKLHRILRWQSGESGRMDIDGLSHIVIVV